MKVSQIIMFVQKNLQLYRAWAQKISWKVPAFCCNDWAAIRTLQICSEITEERPFDIVYGAPRCSWAGGRPSAVNRCLSENDLSLYFTRYKSFGVICALTLSRLVVPQEELADPYCNLLLDMLEEYGGEAIVYDNTLARYIRKTHPNIKIIASLNKAMCDFRSDFEGYSTEVAYYGHLLDLYDEVVIRCECAADDTMLALLRDARSRIEIIVNQFCIPDCPNVYRHLKAIEEWNGSGQKGSCQQCFALETISNMENRLALNLFMSDARINELADSGFTRMKLAGRNIPLSQFLDMISHYIFEPTGAIAIIGNEIIRQYRTQALRNGSELQYYHLPDGRFVSQPTSST